MAREAPDRLGELRRCLAHEQSVRRRLHDQPRRRHRPGHADHGDAPGPHRLPVHHQGVEGDPAELVGVAPRTDRPVAAVALRPFRRGDGGIERQGARFRSWPRPRPRPVLLLEDGVPGARRLDPRPRVDDEREAEAVASAWVWVWGGFEVFFEVEVEFGCVVSSSRSCRLRNDREQKHELQCRCPPCSARRHWSGWAGRRRTWTHLEWRFDGCF